MKSLSGRHSTLSRLCWSYRSAWHHTQWNTASSFHVQAQLNDAKASREALYATMLQSRDALKTEYENKLSSDMHALQTRTTLELDRLRSQADVFLPIDFVPGFHVMQSHAGNVLERNSRLAPRSDCTQRSRPHRRHPHQGALICC